ncbi:MAG: AMP-binding protein [Oscillospiraceae bacterium]|nr:AMP-binding protein [Oscillospiraceae bacterium]
MNKPYPHYEVPVYHDLPELLDVAMARYGNRPVFRTKRRSGERRVSYAQLNAEVRKLSACLQRTIGSGRHVAVLGENCYEWILTYFAVVCSGNVIVPIDRELAAEDIAELLTECDCHFLVFSSAYKDVFHELQDRLPALDGAEQAALYARVEREAPAAWLPTVRDAPAALIYTSGTTGRSKGVVLSQNNLCADARAACAFVRLYGRTIALLPFHHTFAFTVNVLCSITAGVDTLIPTSLKYAAELIASFRPSFLTVVPMILEMLDKKIRRSISERRLAGVLPALDLLCRPFDAVGIHLRGLCFGSVRKGLGGALSFFISGGAPLDPELSARFASYGIPVLNGYGISECSPVVSVNRLGHHRPGSVGQALPGVSVRIDRKGEDEEGEICVKGDIVMLGYHNLAAETSAAMQDGWFHTGDIGKTDRDGFLYVTGRIKNLIILSNGKNVSPEELETYLGRIPGVQEVMVSAADNRLTAEIAPDEDYCKSLEDPQEYFQEQILRLNRRLPPYKAIASVRLRDTAFRKTTTKKIIRQQKEDHAHV